ncbi:MAG: hypothetical protein JWM21_3535 [Acidobacteria bacterium]|nr:hypothetical protein [Acidobacteriota bacterium]
MVLKNEFNNPVSRGLWTCVEEKGTTSENEDTPNNSLQVSAG